MDKLLIVDGMNLLFQMFYGMPARIVSREGKPIQGTLGFVGALLKMIGMTEPTHIAVLFDGECRNFRKDLDGTYKANRPDYSDMDEEDIPFSQLPDIYRALDTLGICYKETSDCEADDWIAGYARSLDGMMDIVIASQDSDFFQLITQCVSVLRYRGRCSVFCDPEYIQDRFGILPEQYADFKSMVGDAADNIPGAHGIGVKTAALLLCQFGDLESIIEDVDQIAKPSIRKSVLENADRLRMNSRLIRLDGAGELPFSLEDMRYVRSGMTTSQVLRAIGLR